MNPNIAKIASPSVGGGYFLKDLFFLTILSTFFLFYGLAFARFSSRRNLAL